MKIPQRIVRSVQNSVELLLHHPLSAWYLIRQREGHKLLWEVVGGADMYFHTTNDGWKEIGEYLKDKICHRFMK